MHGNKNKQTNKQTHENKILNPECFFFVWKKIFAEHKKRKIINNPGYHFCQLDNDSI